MEMSSRPARGGWIEITRLARYALLRWSRPARGGWIEIRGRLVGGVRPPVPPRTGRVD